MFDPDFFRKVMISIVTILYSVYTMPPPQAVLSIEVRHNIIVGIKDRKNNLIPKTKNCNGCR